MRCSWQACRGGLNAVAVMLALAVPAPSGADETERPFELPAMVVEGARVVPDRAATEEDARREIERTPGGAAVVGARDLRDSRAANLEDALDLVPGVIVRPRFGAADESQLSIRGSGLRNNFHLRGINVLVDGFPYGNADGFSDFESLELLATKRIEIWKGANALRFGANTIGGAVNLVTKTGHDVAPVELRSEGGSFGFQKHYGSVGGASGLFDVYLGFADTELDGFRRHAEQVRRRLYGSLGYRLEGGATVRLDGSFVENGENLPGALTREEFERDPSLANDESVRADEQRDYQYGRGALTVSLPIGDAQLLEGYLQANLQDLFHPLSFAILTGDTWSWNAETRYVLAAPVAGRGNRLTAGLQYVGTRQEDVRFENVGAARAGALTRDQTNEALSLGFYLEEQHDWTDRLTLVAGGRVQYSDREVENDLRGSPEERGGDSTDFFAFSPKLGFVYRLTAAADLFGNASHAHEPPLLLELASPATIGGDFDDLDPQEAWQFELGSRGRVARRFEWDVSAFDIELRDEIQNVNIVPFPGAPFTIPRFRNADRTRHSGVEVGGGLELLGLTEERPMRDSLRLRMAYTWSRFRFVDDDDFGDNELPGLPEHLIRAELRYDDSRGWWIAPGSHAVPEAYFADRANTLETDTYALLDVRAGFDYVPWNLTLFVEGRNLVDTSYVASVVVDDAIGRFVLPGDGRAFYGGLGWRWM